MGLKGENMNYEFDDYTIRPTIDETAPPKTYEIIKWLDRLHMNNYRCICYLIWDETTHKHSIKPIGKRLLFACADNSNLALWILSAMEDLEIAL